MKLVFIDIDGPFNTRNNMRRADAAGEKYFYDFFGRKVCQLDKDCVSNLNSLLDKTNAKLVICSSWRIGTSASWFTKFMRNEGLTHDVLALTPSFEMNENNNERGDEILSFISSLHDSQEIENYLVIDDTISELSKIEPNHIIHVDTVSGFNATQLQSALGRLRGRISF